MSQKDLLDIWPISHMVQSGTGSMNLTTLTFPTRNVTGQGQSTLVQGKIYHMISKPLGKQVTLTQYVDANLHHDLVTGKAVTAILHMLNATPVFWHCKKHLTVETATFGSEFVAARTADDQIIDHHLTLMYLGVPISTKSYILGDNKAVVTNTTICSSALRDPILLPTTEFEKQLQHAISSSIGRMGSSTLQTSLASIGDSQPLGLFYSPFFSGEEILLILPPNQRGVTGFQQNMSKSEGSWFDLASRSPLPPSLLPPIQEILSCCLPQSLRSYCTRLSPVPLIGRKGSPTLQTS